MKAEVLLVDACGVLLDVPMNTELRVNGAAALVANLVACILAEVGGYLEIAQLAMIIVKQCNSVHILSLLY